MTGFVHKQNRDNKYIWSEGHISDYSVMERVKLCLLQGENEPSDEPGLKSLRPDP